MPRRSRDGELGEHSFPNLADVPADESPQDRPGVHEEVAVHILDQTVVHALRQEDPIAAHPEPRVFEVEAGEPGPTQVERELNGAMVGPGKGGEAGRQTPAYLARRGSETLDADAMPELWPTRTSRRQGFQIRRARTTRVLKTKGVGPHHPGSDVARTSS